MFLVLYQNYVFIAQIIESIVMIKLYKGLVVYLRILAQEYWWNPLTHSLLGYLHKSPLEMKCG